MWYDSYKTAAISFEEWSFYKLGEQFVMVDCYIEVDTSSGNMEKDTCPILWFPTCAKNKQQF